jgi:hypothetical protein
VLAKETMKDEYYDLLRKLTSTRREVMGKAERFQKESVQKDRDATMQVGVATRTEEHPRTSEAQHPANPLPVPPLVAPLQKEYVCSGVDFRAPEHRRCCGAAFGCPNLAVQCGGHQSVHNCKHIIENNIQLPGNYLSILDKYNKRRRAERQKERRKKKIYKQGLNALI